MAPKKKGGKDKEGGAKADKKPTGPTEEQREELRLKVSVLEDKVLQQTTRIEALQLEHEETKTALTKQQADQNDIVSYLKKEIEKRDAENKALEQKYIELREKKESDGLKAQSDLNDEKTNGRNLKEQVDASATERRKLEDRMLDYQRLKDAVDMDKELIVKLQDELETTRSTLQRSQSQLHILACPDSTNGMDRGGGAIPLLLLEAMRAYISKELLIEQACCALQSVLVGDRKDEAILLRDHGAVELILEAMRTHESSTGVQAAACGLLWKLAFTEQSARKMIVKEGGVQLILYAMQMHLNMPRLQYNACGALRHLLVSGSRDYSVSSQIAAVRVGELPPIVGAPSHAPSQAATRRGHVKGGVRIGTMPAGVPMRGHSMQQPMRASRSTPGFGRADGRARTASKGTDKTHASAIFGRADNLCPSPPRRDGLPDVQPAARDSVLEQALELTLRSMTEHADKALVQEYGCGTLWNLVMANPPMKARVAEENGVKLVLNAMRTHPKQTGVQVNASAVLKELATHTKTLALMKEGGAREALEAAKTNHSFNADLLKMADDTITYLPTEIGI